MSDTIDSALSSLFRRARVDLKFGIERRVFGFEPVKSGSESFSYQNEWISLRGHSKAIDKGFRYRLRIENRSRSSIRITRLHFPAEGGLGAFLEGFDPRKVVFLRNGYQSWSTVRSYRISDKPLRPRLGLVSLATSNMANLPSNTPGRLSSEMYSVIMNLDGGAAMLVGQGKPFNQFLYILLNVDRRGGGSFFELIYDFGRQMIEPGQTIDLDEILFLFGSRPEVEQSYFHGIKKEIGYEPPKRNLKGWCSWYQYYNRISPELLYRNLRALKDRGIDCDFFQIDDGWQAGVGDWLDQSPAFEGRMSELADAIRAAGMKPGLWFAPFAASGDSELARLHPEYILKNEYGKYLKAGYNPIWKGFYYGLDVTHPRYAERLREVVRVMAREWGFEYLKCDFLFAGCLRGAAHHNLDLSRSMILKEGMRLIREEAGAGAVMIGCGMPLSAGIGLVDAMRVGPDTGDFWIKLSGKFLRTGAMVGVRNSLRNFMVRSPMHKRLWLNDPDCVMIRDDDTGLSPAERQAQMDAIALSGGILMYSDDIETLSPQAVSELSLVNRVSDECFRGQAVAVDAMEKELPEIFYNSAGYVAFFNFRGGRSRQFALAGLRQCAPGIRALVDQRSGERLELGDTLVLRNMKHHASRLFAVEAPGGRGAPRGPLRS